jgi:hypothetical protein
VKALSIRQPWAWMILHGGKDIENREWPTRVRGRVLIHASKGITPDEYRDAVWYADQRGVAVPHEVNMQRGGIVGSVEIVDCVMRSDSPWFMGKYGFVLRNPVLLPFQPCRGALGFFDVQDCGGHLPDCDTNDFNLDGIRKPCNCGGLVRGSDAGDCSCGAFA